MTLWEEEGEEEEEKVVYRSLIIPCYSCKQGPNTDTMWNTDTNSCNRVSKLTIYLLNYDADSL